MTPQGYVSVEQLAAKLGVATDRLVAVGDGNGVPKFQFRQTLVYKQADADRLAGIVAKSTPPSSGKPASGVRAPGSGVQNPIGGTPSGLAGPAKPKSPALSDSDDNFDEILGVLNQKSSTGVDEDDDDDEDDLLPMNAPAARGRGGPARLGQSKTPSSSGSGLFDSDAILKEMKESGGPGAVAKTGGAAPAGPQPREYKAPPSGKTPLPAVPKGAVPAPVAQPRAAGSPPAAQRPVGIGAPAAKGPVLPTRKDAGPPAPALGTQRRLIDAWHPGLEPASPELFAAALPVLSPAPVIEADGAPLNIGSDRQLFLRDAAVIDSAKGVTRAVNQPVKHPYPVLQPDRPWETGGPVTLAGSVHVDPDSGLLRMWYHAQGKAGKAACLAVSRDGLNWEKPDLGVHAFEGAGTNIVMIHPVVESYAELAGVVLDPAADPEHRWKAVFLYQNAQTADRGLKTATSPDGIRWTSGESLLRQVTDVSRFTRDPRSGRFVIFGRLMRQGRRGIQRLESEDFVFWSNGEPILEPDAGDPPVDDLYSLGGFAYGRGWVGLLQAYHGNPEHRIDVQLAGSRDGYKWERVADRGVFLPLGKPGEWDRHQISPADRPVVLGNRDLRFYYGGRAQRHMPYAGPDKGSNWGAIGCADLRIDGFAHMEASFEAGTVVTLPLLFTHPELRVNCNSAFGQLQVQLLDVESRPVEGMLSRPIVADSTDQPVVFQSGKNLQSWTGRPMRLRFTLKNAKLYSFWTAPAAG